MTDLAEFLLARTAEDEATARAAHYEGQRWLSEDEGVSRWPDDELVHMADTKADARHIARHDPTRVLADCAAKRRIIELHAFANDFDGCQECGCDGSDREGLGGPWPYPCDTLKLLALPFADHPDYREEWRP